MSVKDEKELRKLEGKGLHIPPPEAEKDSAVNLPPSDEVYTEQEYKAASSGKEEKKQSVGKDISILVVITLAAGLLLGIAFSITKDPIAKAQEDARKKAQSTVMSSAKSFEAMYISGDEKAESVPSSIGEALEDAGIQTTDVTRVDIAYDEDHSPVGCVVTTVNPDGYGGDVELMCGITSNGDGSMVLEGISFLSLSETAGMGMRAKDEDFLSQFTGKKLREGELIAYVKNGASGENEIDAISGCTITTSAVTDDVNAALIAAGQLAESGQIEASGKQDESGQMEATGKKAESGQMESSEKQTESGQVESSEKQTESSLIEVFEQLAESWLIKAPGQQDESGPVEVFEQLAGSGQTKKSGHMGGTEETEQMAAAAQEESE